MGNIQLPPHLQYWGRRCRCAASFHTLAILRQLSCWLRISLEISPKNRGQIRWILLQGIPCGDISALMYHPRCPSSVKCSMDARYKRPPTDFPIFFPHLLLIFLSSPPSSALPPLPPPSIHSLWAVIFSPVPAMEDSFGILSNNPFIFSNSLPPFPPPSLRAMIPKNVKESNPSELSQLCYCSCHFCSASIS